MSSSNFTQPSGCFCLCMGDFVECSCPDISNCPKCKENCPHSSKKKSLTLKGEERKADINKTRFSFLTENEHEKLKEDYVPLNTEKNTKWAIKNFAAWKEARVKRGIEPCPDDLLFSTDPALLSHWLSKYAAETRTVQGKAYPPSTLYQLLTGLLRYMRDTNPEAPNFLDKKDQRFRVLHKSLDSLFRQLRTENIGTSVRHAEVFTKSDEDKLWETGVLGTDSPKSLLNAVFYLNGKNFCLRGGEEYRYLALSQVVRYYSPDRYLYTETGSKNRQGTFTEKHISNKLVPIYACPASGERCHVFILDVYYSKLPEQAFSKDVFYLKPAKLVPTDRTKPWFENVPVGRNELGKMVKNMCTDAGVMGNKTNHSLRATGASSLFRANVPER